LRFQPLLAYTISRNLKPGVELFRWASRLVGFPLDDSRRQERKIMDYLGLMARWRGLGRRDKGDGPEREIVWQGFQPERPASRNLLRMFPKGTGRGQPRW